MANMELITSVTVGSGGAASVTLPATGNIPSTYTDLKIVYSARTDRASNQSDIYLQFNNNTSAVYSFKRIFGSGSGAASDGLTNDTKGGLCGIAAGANATASTFANCEIYIPNYLSSNAKSFSADGASENNATAALMGLYAGLSTDTAAITSIKLQCYNASNFVEGSTFYLYGISNVTSTTKATGGIVSSDGTYWYHMFPYSGTFTPTSAISADVLVIAGGGGGGKDGAAGGGAGGLSYQSARSLSATNYTVTVGAGGTGSTSYTTANPTGGNGNAGSNSVFDTITSNGGGLGATDNTTNYRNGGTGGSGGGASREGTAGSANQGNSGGATGFGNAGGTGYSSNPYKGGGGGGAGAAGSNADSSNTNAAGGAGVNTYSSWATATQTGVNGYYAGGGGGAGYFPSANPAPGTGGLGGGGAGGGGNTSGSGVASSGIANTGGGGGGGGANVGGISTNGGNGGSGLVIIRYAI